VYAKIFLTGTSDRKANLNILPGPHLIQDEIGAEDLDLLGNPLGVCLIDTLNDS
jgi:hypothetical protein